MISRVSRTFRRAVTLSGRTLLSTHRRAYQTTEANHSNSALLGNANPGNSSFLTSPSSSINLSSFLHDEVDLSGLMPRAMDDFNVKRINSTNDDHQQNHQSSPIGPVKPFPLCPQLSYTGIGQGKPTCNLVA